MEEVLPINNFNNLASLRLIIFAPGREDWGIRTSANCGMLTEFCNTVQAK